MLRSLRHVARSLSRAGLVLLVAVLSGACVTRDFDWVSTSDTAYPPLPEDADVEVWVAPPPSDFFAYVDELDNPPVGLGPPGARSLAWIDGSLDFTIVATAWTSNQAVYMLDLAQDKARAIGGDVVVVRHGVARQPFIVLDVMRSRP